MSARKKERFVQVNPFQLAHKKRKMRKKEKRETKKKKSQSTTPLGVC
jgi:hypothetical protein